MREKSLDSSLLFHGTQFDFVCVYARRQGHTHYLKGFSKWGKLLQKGKGWVVQFDEGFGS